MQQLNPSEISEIIKQRIDSLDVSVQPKMKAQLSVCQTGSSVFSV